MSPRLDSIAFVLAATLASVSAAEAHPLVDDARRLVDEADFAAAERAFAAAEAATDLSRADLVALLEGRALLHHALADGAALEADLARLAALDPGHAFGPRMPPELAESFLRVRTRAAGPLRVDVSMRPVPGGLALSATATNDPGGLVRTLEVHARVAGAPWRTAADELVVTGAPGAGVELWAVARGPGGVAVATRGSEQAPVTALVPGGTGRSAGVELAVRGEQSPPPPPASSKTWIWVTAGAVGLAAIVTTVILVFAVRSEETTVEPPQVQGR